jgi:hypothetical protein
MTVLPGTYPLPVPQRATLRQKIRIKANGNLIEAYAQIYNNARRTTKILDLDVEWITRSETVDGETWCEFDLVAPWTDTQNVTRNGFWDLLIVTIATGERSYYLEGPAVVDPGLTVAGP